MRRRPLGLLLVVALALPGCRATGRAANAYLDWSGRTFSTNPVSAPFYYLGFGVFFVAGLPLDLISVVATWIGWPNGSGEDYQGSCLAPSFFLGATGGTLLGAPFWPFGLPWWDPDREDDEPPPAAPKKAEAVPVEKAPPRKEAEEPARPREPARSRDKDDPDDAPAGGGPRR